MYVCKSQLHNALDQTEMIFLAFKSRFWLSFTKTLSFYPLFWRAYYTGGQLCMCVVILL